MKNYFKLRPWDVSDLGSLVKYANNWNIAKNMTDKFPYPYKEEDGVAFINFANSDKPIRIFAIEIDGEAVGAVGIHPQEDIYRKNAELGYWIAEPYWGKGIISEVIKQIIDIAFETFDIERVFARPFENNIASQKVLEKNNFILEGRFHKVLYKNNAFIDELIYAIRRENWQKGKNN